jgi:tetraacyldisaccharide 4'-kinase
MSAVLARLAEDVWTRRTRGGRLAGALLAPASWSYGAVVAARNRRYDRGGALVERVPARVVSVGNLTVGGSGKTPFTLWLASRLAARGRRVAIVARGYRKRLPGVVVVGRDGTPLVSARDGGDEAVLLARRFAGPVVVGEDRVAAAREACRAFAAEVIVLDDGFQHRRLGRDLDIVLLASDPSVERLLPAGPLREPLGALARAGAIVAMDAPPAVLAVGPRGLPRFQARTAATTLVEVRDGRWRERDVDTLAGRDVVALAGIARPERFVASLEALGARVRRREFLADHHGYDGNDLARVAAWAAHGLVVTTEKDLVKLADLERDPPVLALRVSACAEPAAELERLAAGEDVVCGEPDPERR